MTKKSNLPFWHDGGSPPGPAVYISLDGRNITHLYEVVGLIHILKQLRTVAENIGLSVQLETVCPGYGDFKIHAKKISEHSRLISLYIWHDDKEVDDYVAVSLASAHDGFYVSNDLSMQEHIGKDNDWAEERRIRYRRNYETKQMELMLPEGPLSEAYTRLKEEGLLTIDLEDWETQLLVDKEAEKKEKEMKGPKKYFCPTCDEQFPKLKHLNEHRKLSRHACITCEDCSEVLLGFKTIEEHSKTTGHDNYSGQLFKLKDMRITEEMKAKTAKEKAARLEQEGQELVAQIRQFVLAALTDGDNEKQVLGFPDINEFIKEIKSSHKFSTREFYSCIGLKIANRLDVNIKGLLELCQVPHTLSRDSEAGIDYVHYSPADK